MKNQRKNRPQGQLKGTWDQQYHGPQKAHHTADLNTIKTSHKKPLNRGNR